MSLPAASHYSYVENVVDEVKRDLEAASQRLHQSQIYADLKALDEPVEQQNNRAFNYPYDNHQSPSSKSGTNEGGPNHDQIDDESSLYDDNQFQDDNDGVQPFDSGPYRINLDIGVPLPDADSESDFQRSSSGQRPPASTSGRVEIIRALSPASVISSDTEIDSTASFHTARQTEKSGTSNEQPDENERPDAFFEPLDDAGTDADEFYTLTDGDSTATPLSDDEEDGNHPGSHEDTLIEQAVGKLAAADADSLVRKPQQTALDESLVLSSDDDDFEPPDFDPQLAVTRADIIAARGALRGGLKVVHATVTDSEPEPEAKQIPIASTSRPLSSPPIDEDLRQIDLEISRKLQETVANSDEEADSDSSSCTNSGSEYVLNGVPAQRQVRSPPPCASDSTPTGSGSSNDDDDEEEWHRLNDELHDDDYDGADIGEQMAAYGVYRNPAAHIFTAAGRDAENGDAKQHNGHAKRKSKALGIPISRAPIAQRPPMSSISECEDENESIVASSFLEDELDTPFHENHSRQRINSLSERDEEQLPPVAARVSSNVGAEKPLPALPAKPLPALPAELEEESEQDSNVEEPIEDDRPKSGQEEEGDGAADDSGSVTDYENEEIIEQERRKRELDGEEQERVHENEYANQEIIYAVEKNLDEADQEGEEEEEAPDGEDGEEEEAEDGEVEEEEAAEEEEEGEGEEVEVDEEEQAEEEEEDEQEEEELEQDEDAEEDAGEEEVEVEEEGEGEGEEDEHLGDESEELVVEEEEEEAEGGEEEEVELRTGPAATYRDAEHPPAIPQRRSSALMPSQNAAPAAAPAPTPLVEKPLPPPPPSDTEEEEEGEEERENVDDQVGAVSVQDADDSLPLPPPPLPPMAEDADFTDDDLPLPPPPPPPLPIEELSGIDDCQLPPPPPSDFFRQPWCSLPNEFAEQPWCSLPNDFAEEEEILIPELGQLPMDLNLEGSDEESDEDGPPPPPVKRDYLDSFNKAARSSWCCLPNEFIDLASLTAPIDTVDTPAQHPVPAESGRLVRRHPEFLRAYSVGELDQRRTQTLSYSSDRIDDDAFVGTRNFKRTPSSPAILLELGRTSQFLETDIDSGETQQRAAFAETDLDALLATQARSVDALDQASRPAHFIDADLDAHTQNRSLRNSPGASQDLVSKPDSVNVNGNGGDEFGCFDVLRTGSIAPLSRSRSQSNESLLFEMQPFKDGDLRCLIALIGKKLNSIKRLLAGSGSNANASALRRYGRVLAACLVDLACKSSSGVAQEAFLDSLLSRHAELGEQLVGQLDSFCVCASQHAGVAVDQEHLRCDQLCNRLLDRLATDAALVAGCSKLARVGSNLYGNGVLLFVFHNAEVAQRFVAADSAAPDEDRDQPFVIYLSARHTRVYLTRAVGQQLDRLVDLCSLYDSDTQYICAALLLDRVAESPNWRAAANWRVVDACIRPAGGRRAASNAQINASSLSLLSAQEPAAADSVSLLLQQADLGEEEEELRRKSFVGEVQRVLREYRISLRHSFPDVHAMLTEFVANGRSFEPTTIRFVSTDENRCEYECVISSSQLPQIRKVQVPLAKRQKSRPPPLDLANHFSGPGSGPHSLNDEPKTTLKATDL